MCHKRATKWFWSSWGCVQVLIMTLAILLFSPVSAYTMDSGIDLLSELNLYSNYSSYHGVSLTQGYHNGSMAFRLQTNERKLLIPASGYYRIAELIRNSAEFTLTAILKQERGNTGSIIAFSYGLNRYLELESSGKRDEIRFHYTYQTSNGQLQVHTEAFSYQLADENWHKVALSVSGPEIQLLIDCHPLYKRVNHFLPDRNFSASNMQLYIGQRNSNNHSVFKGYIQSAHVIARPHGYLSQCPHMHEQCPTCAQFSLLQRTIDELQKNLINLTQRLVAAESRVSRLEECECKISCKINGTTKADGVEWRDGCNICRCERGSIICEPQRCDPTSCKNPVYEDGACCPKCLKKCYLRKKEYEHGEIHIEGCRNCSCQDGSMRCEKMNCPKLNCSSGEIILAKDECCEVCKGDDYCSKGHACHTNATCLNLYTKYTCTCRQGFQGDGFQCSDIDECAQQGGLNGNHCHYNTRCVNTPGSYKCECLPGFRRLDKFNCVEIDECASGQHSCHENANCINTQGSYHCECKDGYTGNGYDCKPICNQTCLHGGQCSAPNVCTCRMGFIGLSCEQDLDECTTGLHSCKESSECVNMPGWYYCKCKSGYHTLGPECIDIDECSHHTHTCHPTAQCINTEGHFECHCPKHSNANECKMSCMFEDIEVPEGSTISPRNQPCKTCVCNKGVITCAEPKCNCSNWKPTSGRDLCCPQCDSNESCRHQELDHVVFKSGEQWIYQCQTCECLYGEFDCWKLECPPLTCENPLPLQPGDCCQRCPDDPCNSFAGNITSISTKSASLTSNHNYNSRSNSNSNGNNNDINNKIDTGNLCIYGGHQYASGQIFNDPTNQCTTCGCKDGQLFCSVDNSCTDSNNESYKVPTIKSSSTSTTALLSSSPSLSSTLSSGAFSSASISSSSSSAAAAGIQDNIDNNSNNPVIFSSASTLSSSASSMSLLSTVTSDTTSPFSNYHHQMDAVSDITTNLLATSSTSKTSARTSKSQHQQQQQQQHRRFVRQTVNNGNHRSKKNDKKRQRRQKHQKQQQYKIQDKKLSTEEEQQLYNQQQPLQHQQPSSDPAEPSNYNSYGNDNNKKFSSTNRKSEKQRNFGVY